MEVNYGLWALLPAIVAIFMCFKTKQVIPSLFAGVFIAGVIVSKGNIFQAVSFSLETIVGQLSDPGNAKLILFTMFMGVGISFIWKMSGSKALSIWANHRESNLRFRYSCSG